MLSRAEVIRGAIYRAGYSRKIKKLMELAGMSKSTYYDKLGDKTSWTIPELHRIDKVVRFTDDECVALIRAKE